MKLIRKIAGFAHAIVTTRPSQETIRRVKRTFWQTLQSSAVVGVATAKVAEDARALAVSVLVLIGTVLSSYAQNVLEDAEKLKDRR